jgi:hypothetical protein
MRTAKEIFSNLIQIGMITDDAEKTLENLEKTLGIGPFRVVEYPPKDEIDCKRFVNQMPSNFTGKFCFFNFGNIEFEVIQPTGGENIWSEFLKMNNGPGLHHLKYMIQSHEEVHEHFEKLGIKEIQSGASVGLNKGRVWAYYDTYETLGFYTEVMNEKKHEENI